MRDQIKSGDVTPASEIVLLANFRYKNSDPTEKEQAMFRLYRCAIAAHDADPCPETHATVAYSCERWKDAYNELLYSNFGGAA
jgi:hypothetical protein